MSGNPARLYADFLVELSTARLSARSSAQLIGMNANLIPNTARLGGLAPIPRSSLSL